MIPSINTGDISLDKFINLEGYKAQNTYNIREDSSTKYYVVGVLIVLYFLFYKNK